MVVGGIIVGYITSKYLYRINELNKVEGMVAGETHSHLRGTLQANGTNGRVVYGFS